MKIARRMEPIKPSATLAITTRAKQLKAAGQDVIGFGAGEPDFPTPDFIIDAMVEAARSGATRYAPVAGLPALRSAIAGHFAALYGQPWDPAETLVSVGGKHGLYGLFQVLLDPGDEVIVPAPYWVSYPPQIRLAGGVPVTVNTNIDAGFSLDLDEVAAAITDRTVGIVLNSPNNPTGAVQPAAALRGVADLAERHDMWMISDDIYSHLLYDGAAFCNVLTERPDLRDRVIIVHGASKTYAMTGWRIGFVGAPEHVISKLATLQGQSTSNATSFAQYGALAAVESDHGFLAGWLEAYDGRRRRMVDLSRAIDGVACHLPGGAFYAFPDIRDLLGRRLDGRVLETSIDFCAALLDRALVAAVPGDPFGAPGFMRLSYACSMGDVERGLSRIREFVTMLG